MPFVQAKCENCGGILAVDSDQKAAICPFCQMPYVVRDAINNYNYVINNNTSINAESVNVYAQKDFEIKGGILVSYNGERTVVEIPSQVIEIGERVFADTAIHKVIIPSNVKLIRQEAFSGCKGLIDVSFSVGLVEIGRRSFAGCENLNCVELPEGLEVIGQCAFENCNNMTSIRIKSGIKEIGVGAFMGCFGLKEVNIPEGIEVFDFSAFTGGGFESLTLPISVNRVTGFDSLRWGSKLRRIDIPKELYKTLLKQKRHEVLSAAEFDLMYVDGEKISGIFEVVIAPYSCTQYSFILTCKLLCEGTLIAEEDGEYSDFDFSKKNYQISRSSGLFKSIRCPELRKKIESTFNMVKDDMILRLDRHECVFCGRKNGIFSQSFDNCKTCGRLRLINVRG